MVSTKTEKVIQIISIALQGLSLMFGLIFRIYLANYLLPLCNFNDNDYWDINWAIDYIPMVLISTAVTIMLLALQLTSSQIGKKSIKWLSCLIMCVTVGLIMYVAEEAEADYLTLYYCVTTAATVLSCALLLYLLRLNPRCYLVFGGIFAVWGFFELMMGESVFDERNFSIMFLDAGIVLLACGFVLWNRNERVETAPAAVQAPVPTPPAAEPVVTPISEPVAVPKEPVQPKRRFCRHCGTKLEDGDIYCVECGNKV